MLRKISVLSILFSLSLAFGLGSAQASSTEILLGPALSIPQPTNMHVWWHTSQKTSNHEVEYGTTQALRQKEVLNKDTAYPYLQISHLKPGTTYYYRVKSDDAVSKINSFKTYQPGSDFKIGLWADNQHGYWVFNGNTLPTLLRFKPDFLITAGDLVNDGTHYPDWGKQLYGPAHNVFSTIPWFPVRGNHDGESELALKMCPLPDNNHWYARTLGPIRLVVMDSNLDLSKDSDQYSWLEKEVISPAWRSASFRFVAFHHPPFTNLWDSPGYDGDQTIREDVVPLLELNGADVVLNGHAHAYEHGIRKGPLSHTHYYIIGGAGGTLDRVKTHEWPHIDSAHSRYHVLLGEVSADKVKFSAVDTFTGEVFDHTEIIGHTLK